MYYRDIQSLENQVFGEEPGPEEPWEPEDGPVMLTAAFGGGEETEYRVDGVFLEGGKEYIALETGDGEILIMELGQGEDDEIRLLPIEDEEEGRQALAAYEYFFDQREDGSSREIFQEETKDREEGEREDDRDQNREED